MVVEAAKAHHLQEWSRATEKELANIGERHLALAESFRPTAEYGAMQLCRKAAQTSAHHEWHKRLRDHRHVGEQRLIGTLADNYQATKKLLDDAARRQVDLSARDRRNMVEACTHEDGRSVRERRHLEKASALERGMVDNREQHRLQTNQWQQTGQVKQCAILAQAAQTQRENAQHSERQFAEITRHKLPPSPHSPRQALTRRALATLTTSTLAAGGGSPKGAAAAGQAAGGSSPHGTATSWNSAKRHSPR